MVNGKKCKVLWDVNDSKISHVDTAVVDDIIKRPGERYRNNALLTTTRGKVHE